MTRYGRNDRRPPPGGRGAWGPDTGYSTGPRKDKQNNTIPGEHHTVYSPPHNMRFSWDTDERGEFAGEEHATDQTDRSHPG